MKTKEANSQEDVRQLPDWWRSVPTGEKHVIRNVLALVRGLKRSQIRPVAQAARKWELGITGFIKWRLINARPMKVRNGKAVL